MKINSFKTLTFWIGVLLLSLPLLLWFLDGLFSSCSEDVFDFPSILFFPLVLFLGIIIDEISPKRWLKIILFISALGIICICEILVPHTQTLVIVAAIVNAIMLITVFFYSIFHKDWFSFVMMIVIYGVLGICILIDCVNFDRFYFEPFFELVNDSDFVPFVLLFGVGGGLVMFSIFNQKWRVGESIFAVVIGSLVWIYLIVNVLMGDWWWLNWCLLAVLGSAMIAFGVRNLIEEQ